MAESSSSSSSADGGYWGWLSAAKNQALELASKAQEMAETAGKAAQEKALKIVEQAREIQHNYDLEVASSMFTGGVPGPNFQGGEFKLTKAALRQLDMTYVTENIIAMAFPKDLSQPGKHEECNDINVVAAYLKKRHQGRYMIWNISEESYDYSRFADQVLEYKFPGHPAPPLGLLFKICTSVESWLDADDKNVAVVHCLTGKGRTATLIACILTWLGEFDSPMQALQYVAQRRGSMVDFLTIPSQRRYIQYFSNMLDGIRPSSEPLLLRRIILNSIPQFAKLPDSDADGCCPYVQLFKNGKLIATAAPYLESHHHGSTSSSGSSSGGSGSGGVASSSGESKLQLRWISTAEGSASFRVDCPVQGDILLRCRHASASGARVSMFRAAFHTGYISGGVLRLTKAQLDGSPSDPRYHDDFFVDLIFAPVSKASDGDVLPSDGASVSTDNGLLIDSSLADKYEQGLHKDARFWESITARKLRTKRRKQRKFAANEQDQFRIAEDSKFLDEEEETSTVSFFSALTSASSTASKAADEELIKQLALAERDETDASAGDGLLSHSLSFSSLSHATSASSAAGAGGGLASSGSLSTPLAKGSAAAELQALEDLEKELGLGDLQLFSTEKIRHAQGGRESSVSAPSLSAGAAAPSSTSGGAGSAGDSVVVDDLDELEKYLQSLSSGTS